MNGLALAQAQVNSARDSLLASLRDLSSMVSEAMSQLDDGSIDVDMRGAMRRVDDAMRVFERFDAVLESIESAQRDADA